MKKPFLTLVLNLFIAQGALAQKIICFSYTLEFDGDKETFIEPKRFVLSDKPIVTRSPLKPEFFYTIQKIDNSTIAVFDNGWSEEEALNSESTKLDLKRWGYVEVGQTIIHSFDNKDYSVKFNVICSDDEKSIPLSKAKNHMIRKNIKRMDGNRIFTL